MQSCVAMLLFTVGLMAMNGEEPQLRRFQFNRTEMAVPITIVIYSPDASIANRAAQAAFDRIHELNNIMSDYDPQSELCRLFSSSSVGKGIKVSDDLWRVLEYAQTISQRTDGAFDISIGPAVRLWRRARMLKEMPSPEDLNKALARTGYQSIRLDAENHSVELLKPGMRLDLGGIAKGYALDEAYALLQKHGLNRAMIEAGGDIRLGEPPPNKPGWRIGIGQIGAKNPPQFYLSLSRTAVATSGDMWQFVVIGGKKYSHIIDPKTGIGLTDAGQVTVIAPNGITADALATAVSVLGPEKGLKLIESMPNAAAYIVRAIDGKIETHESKRCDELEKFSRERAPTEGWSAKAVMHSQYSVAKNKWALKCPPLTDH
jgi:FAD:protein FMN transferase